jgi:hypothetical protein
LKQFIDILLSSTHLRHDNHLSQSMQRPEPISRYAKRVVNIQTFFYLLLQRRYIAPLKCSDIRLGGVKSYMESTLASLVGALGEVALAKKEVGVRWIMLMGWGYG